MYVNFCNELCGVWSTLLLHTVYLHSIYIHTHTGNNCFDDVRDLSRDRVLMRVRVVDQQSPRSGRSAVADLLSPSLYPISSKSLCRREPPKRLTNVTRLYATGDGHVLYWLFARVLSRHHYNHHHHHLNVRGRVRCTVAKITQVIGDVKRKIFSIFLDILK